jgi:hypothetical protein
MTSNKNPKGLASTVKLTQTTNTARAANANTQTTPLQNPFTPMFGKIPPFMAGREHMISDIIYALDSEGNDPNLLSLFTGPRGSGKTALLSYIANIAGAHGWVAINLSCKKGMLDDALIQTRDAASQFIEQNDKIHLSGITVGQAIGLQWSRNAESIANWRKSMGDIINELNSKNIGLLITIDEVRSDIAEMIEFADVLQHFIREDKKVAVIMAGLPNNVSALVSDKSVSFLRRARIRHLGKISDSEVSLAIKTSIEQAGRDIGEGAVERAVCAIDGFAYLIQLVGYRAWALHPTNKEITLQDVEQAIPLAKNELIDGVLFSTYRELSDCDLDFLCAMLKDEGPTKQSELASRLNKSTGHVRVYKERLISQGIITEERKGYLTFELPYFKEYLMQKV